MDEQRSCRTAPLFLGTLFVTHLDADFTYDRTLYLLGGQYHTYTHTHTGSK